MTLCFYPAQLVADEPVQEFITETWTYDANARTVIYDPGDSHPTQTATRKRKIIESADGRTITVQDGAGHDLFRRKIVPNTGRITEIQEIYEYSPPTAGWQEIHRTEINPRVGWISQMEGGRIDTKVIVQTAVPGETKTIIRGPALGLSLDISLGGGLATGVSGKVGQTPVSLAFQHRFGIQTGVTGQIGGRAVGYETGLDWQLSGFTTPTGTWTVSHDEDLATPQGFSIKQTASEGRSYEAQWDAIGNLIEQKGSGFLPLQTPTSNTTTGSRTKLNTQVDIDTNQYGLTKAKRYGPNGADGPVNLEEIYTRHPDGSLASFSIGGTISGSVAYGELSRTVTFSDYIRAEQFYRNGPRSSVTANNDGRAFQYDVMQMHKETHTAGPWQGSSVQWGRDDLGRVSDLTISVSGRPAKTIRYGYLPGGELFSITAPYVAGKYAYSPNGDRESVAVNGITQVWRRNAATGFLESVKESNQETRTYTPDTRFRIGGSNGPEGIRAFTYDDANQLKSTTGFNPGFSYAYDGRGNRTLEARAAHDAIAKLDQFKGRTLTERGFILSGKVTPPNANETLTLKAKHPWATIGGDSIPFDAQGRFRFHKSVPLGLAERVDAIVESVHGRPNAPPSLLQKPVSFMLPGSSETMLHDPAGRRTRDAMWQYAWNDAGHLMRMTRVGPFPEPHMTEDVLEFTYDADGRRTGKKRTRKYDNANDRVSNQRFLWAGSVMVGEERTGDGAEQANFRWYIWGADISGSTEGAAGIGGLLAIVDETHTGDVARVLHPNYDGMGNVVSLYSDSGQKVVAYDHGPFGEDLGGYGNLAACPFRWQTRYYDAETGLYYFGYRYYDPTVGKWLSRDPIGEEGGFNLYAYCGNDPINGHDPLGLAANLVIGAFVGGGVDLFLQMAVEKRSFSDVNWYRVGASSLLGAVTSGTSAFVAQGMRSAGTSIAGRMIGNGVIAGTTAMMQQEIINADPHSILHGDSTVAGAWGAFGGAAFEPAMSLFSYVDEAGAAAWNAWGSSSRNGVEIITGGAPTRAGPMVELVQGADGFWVPKGPQLALPAPHQPLLLSHSHPPRRLTHYDFNAKPIVSDSRLHRMWEDSIRELYVGVGENGQSLRIYLNNFSNATSSQARAAFNSVRSKFIRKVNAAMADGEEFPGISFERVHHWNWHMSRHAQHALDPRQLFPVSLDTHKLIHSRTAIGPFDSPLDMYFNPINPLHIMDLDNAYPLAPR